MLTLTKLTHSFLFVGISIFGVMNVTAQNSTRDSLNSRFNAFRSKSFSEKIFLHTDRSSYFTGETVWFNMYHVDASFHKPISWSKVLYAELIDSNGKSVLQGKFSLCDTATTGSLFLPASLNSGNYQLIAYTRWMKNFAPEYFFKQTIRIINPFIELSKEVAKGPEYDVQFFPEGGRLVSGLESVVGVRVAGRNGQGIDFIGAILNQQNDTVARFRPLKFGLGKFIFIPEVNQVYKASITDSNKKQFTYSLPSVADHGYVMRVSELATKIKVTVSTRNENAVSVYLLTHTRQLNVTTEQQTFKDGEAVFMLDKKKLNDGVSHFTVFNEQLIPVCERLWFKKPSHSLQIETSISQSVFSARQKADVQINCQANDTSASISNLSVVVYKADSLDLPVENLVSYLMLTSDLTDNVEHTEYYFGNESTELSEATNNLMLTHGWRRFAWSDVAAQRHNMRHVPELGGHIISGRIINAKTNKPASFVATYLTFPGLPLNLYISRSDSLGRIMFETQLQSGNKNLIVQADDKNRVYQLELNDPFLLDFRSNNPVPFLLTKRMKSSVQQRSMHMQVHTLFNPGVVMRKSISKSQPFYGNADEQYLLDDYTRFPTMEEVMREYVPGVRVSKTKGHFQLSNMDMVSKFTFKDNPLVLIDGVPAFDMDKVMEIDPLKIKKLDVITKRYYLQAASFDGIVSLASYKSDLGGFQPPANALLTSYSGFEEQREFFTPVYQTEKQIKSTTPDVRYVLYRSTGHLQNSGNKINLSFYTSDITGQYTVVVQGITRDGLPGYSLTTFQVK